MAYPCKVCKHDGIECSTILTMLAMVVAKHKCTIEFLDLENNSIALNGINSDNCAHELSDLFYKYS